MFQILHEFMEDKESCSSEEELESQKWFNGINRGGLTCCSDDFYNFYTVEVSIKDALQTYTNTLNLTKITEQITSNTNVNQTWTTLCSTEIITEQYVYDELLNEILKFCIQIRGFAFTSKWMEDFKKKKKKNLQKTKSLRNKIQGMESYFQSQHLHTNILY